MAKKSSVGIQSLNYVKKAKKRRPGVVSKNTAGKIATSKNYFKKYRGQGR
jgi:hypothetical protein